MYSKFFIAVSVIFFIEKNIYAACYTQGTCCTHKARLFTPDKPIIPAIVKAEQLAQKALKENEELRQQLHAIHNELVAQKEEIEHLREKIFYDKHAPSH